MNKELLHKWTYDDVSGQNDTSADCTAMPVTLEQNDINIDYTKVPQPILVRASEITEKPIKWLWKNKFPSGALSLMTGLSGVGKTFLTVHITATVTTGRNWADGSPCELGSVLFFYGEEGIADTYNPRFRVNGADLSKIVFLKGVESTEDNRNGFLTNRYSDTDITLLMVDSIKSAIQQTARTTGFPVKVVVIDPISNYWGFGVNENANTDVRRILKPLQLLAESTEVAFILIQHTGKGEKDYAQQRVLGSTGIVATCRSVWGVYFDPSNTVKRLLAPLKTNCCIAPTTVSYQIVPPDGTVEILESNIRMTAEPSRLLFDEQPLSPATFFGRLRTCPAPVRIATRSTAGRTRG